MVGKSRSLILVPCLLALAAAACSNPAPTNEQMLSHAGQAFEADQYGTAEKAYRAILQFDPKNHLALARLGTIYLDQGQVLDAYPLLQQAADLQPENIDLQVKLGLASFALGLLGPAREAAQRVLVKAPGEETALSLLIDTAASPEDLREVQQAIERMRQPDQPPAGYHLALGLLHLRLQDAARAESELKTALELAPRWNSALFAMGRLHWSRDQLEAADEAMRMAADLSPLRSQMRMRYVDFKLRTGALSEAKAILDDLNKKLPDFLPPRVYLMRMACQENLSSDCFTRVQDVLAQDPTNFDAVFQDSIFNLTKGNFAQATKQLEYLNSAYRDRPPLLHQLAVAYLAFAGRASPVDARDAIDKAASRLTEAIKLDPRFWPAVVMYAELQIRSGRPTVVLDSLLQATKEAPEIVEAHYLLAAAYRATQQDSEAVAVLRRMATLFPQDPQPPLAAGTILLAQGQLLEARKEFERAAVLSPDNLSATEAIVNLDLSAKQFAAAMERVDSAIARNATSAPLWALRAKVYSAQQDIAQAEKDLLKAVSLDPNLEPVHLLLAQLYASSNRHNQAIEQLTRFIERSKSVPALLQLASLHEQAKNFAAAREVYERLLSLSPDSVAALNNLAWLYAEHLGQLDAAFDLAKRARDSDPNEPAIADTLGWILFKKADYANALRLLQESATKRPDRPDLQFRVGMAHYMLGDEVAARAALHNAAEGGTEFPEKAEARQRLALLAINAETAPAAARTEISNFLRDRPNDPAALFRLAQLQLRDSATDQAVKTLETVVAAHPSYRPALRRLALLYGERLTGDPKAYEVMQAARLAYPEDNDLAKALGILAYRRQLFAQSAQLLEGAARARQDDPELLYYLGAAYQELKQWKSCVAVLERAVNLQPPSAVAEKAKLALAGCLEAASL